MEKPWEEKCWGKTRQHHRGDDVHELLLVAGGFCSLHYHEHRTNRFQVTTGRVRVVRCYAWRVVPTVLEEGDVLVIHPGIPHQFQVLESGRMVEEYWSQRGPCDLADIVRLTTGGIIDPKWLVDFNCGVVMDSRHYASPHDLREVREFPL